MIAVARKGEAPLRQIAKDFGISGACLHRWLTIADREDGVDRPGIPAAGDMSAQLREAHRRIKLVTLSPEQLAALDAAGALVAGDRFEDLSWVSAGRE